MMVETITCNLSGAFSRNSIILLYSRDIERLWLPVVGPTAVASARTLLRWASEGDGQCTVPFADLAQAVGCPHKLGTDGPVYKSLGRLRFRRLVTDMALTRNQLSLSLRTCWPWPDIDTARKHLLPDDVAAVEDYWEVAGIR